MAIDSNLSRQPIKIIRAGNTELVLCFLHFLESQRIDFDHSHLHRFLKHLYASSGYFDQSNTDLDGFTTTLESFLNTWKNSLQGSELLVLQDSLNEINQISPEHKKAFFDSLKLDKLTYRNSFDYNLLSTLTQGHRTLVVSPFAPIIQKQYEIGNLKFIRPQFEPSSLKTFRFPYLFQSNFYSNSIQALEQLSVEIDQIVKQSNSQSIVLSCGCYGAPLADYFYRQGLDAIYFGGDLQIYFGIMGNRWRSNFQNQPWFEKQKSYWIMEVPPEFIPTNSGSIENACYW